VTARILIVLILLGAATIGSSAQAPAAGALSLVADLERLAALIKTPGNVRNDIQEKLADLRLLLEQMPTCPVQVPCPTCPPPTVCQEPTPTPTPTPTPEPTPTPPPASGATVSTSAELVAAFKTGGTFTLAPGTYTGNFVASAPTTLVGASGLTGRATPADVAAWKLVAGDKFNPVLTVPAGGSGSVVRGVTLTGVAPDRVAVIVGNTTAPTDLAQLPSNVLLDQVAVLGLDGLAHRGVELHGTNLSLTNSHVSGIVERFRQSQGVWIAYGPGPYLVENNYIEATGENLLVGGDDPKIQGMIPSDIVIRGNDFKKLQEWRTTAPNSVVNILELKNAQRVLIERNTLDGSWTDIQTGMGFTFTPRNQYGKASWSTVRDVVVRYNVVKNYENYAIHTLYTDNNFPSGTLTNLTVEHNLFQGPGGVWIVNGIDGDFKVVNNTMPAITKAVIMFNGAVPPTGVGAPGRPNFTFNKNAVLSGRYSIGSQSGGGQGIPSITSYTTPVLTSGNVIEENLGWGRWPGGNTILTVGGLAPLLDAEFKYTGTAQAGAGW
jgi:hypothetical protein